MSLEIVRAMDRAFRGRGLDHHAHATGVEILPYGKRRAVLIFDQQIAAAVLTSRAFLSDNFYASGLARERALGRPLPLMEQFWASNPMFQEGENHGVLKAHFKHCLALLESELADQTPRLRHFFWKRRARINNPVAFAQILARVCVGLCLVRLLGVRMRNAYAALGMRENLFFCFFHAARHEAYERALECLYRDSTLPTPNSPDWPRHLVAQSLLFMGVDPLVGSICASLMEHQPRALMDGVYRHCPTSFLTRTCNEAIRINDCDFLPGDFCQLALVPSQTERDARSADTPTRQGSLAFGLGQHACSGKHLTARLCELAEQVLEESFPDGFRLDARLQPDGAFLAFAADPAS